jgi:hypothetical protein
MIDPHALAVIALSTEPAGPFVFLVVSILFRLVGLAAVGHVVAVITERHYMRVHVDHRAHEEFPAFLGSRSDPEVSARAFWDVGRFPWNPRGRTIRRIRRA